MNIHSYIQLIDELLAEAQADGIDHELILAEVYAKHLASDEKLDQCHVYGITFAEKLNELMSEKTNAGRNGQNP